jgi:iodotyrosine deiodinase
MVEKIFLPLVDYLKYPEAEMEKRASEFYAEMVRRRSVRDFSDRPVDRNVLEDCMRTASTALSGANQQPWRFVVVSDLTVKRQISEAAEKIEKEFYSKKATKKWVTDLDHLGTVPDKPFLETAPYLIVIFPNFTAI